MCQRTTLRVKSPIHSSQGFQGQTFKISTVVGMSRKTFMVKFPMYNCTCAVEYQGRVFTVAMYNKSHLFTVTGVSSVKRVH